MKKRISLLLSAGLLLTSVVSVGAATTYIDCGSTRNSRYSTITAEDRYDEQMSAAQWRHTGITIVYVEDISSGKISSKPCSINRSNITVWSGYNAKIRAHFHYATDHQS